MFAFYLTEITHNTRPNKYGAAQSSHMDLKTIFYFVCVFCRFFILVALTSSSRVCFVGASVHLRRPGRRGVQQDLNIYSIEKERKLNCCCIYNPLGKTEIPNSITSKTWDILMLCIVNRI